MYHDWVRTRHFATAKKASFKSDHPMHRLGAVVAKGNKVISVGWNKYRTHPKSPHPFKHLHAEIMALFQCGEEEAKGADLYVYREGKDGIPRLSKPCKTCMSVIKKAGIKRVFFTNLGYTCLEV
jgi:deoxycytidylate deaminase